MAVKVTRQPLVWAWGFVLFWGFHALYAAYAGDQIAVVIALLGLLAALLVLSAIYGRRRKTLYPDNRLPSERV